MQHLWDEVKDGYQQILIAHNSIEQSTENLRLNNDYYSAGITTMSDLLDAQSLYQQSRDKLVEVYSQYKIKILEYTQATAQ
jgi:outer membrane protein TolC